MYYLSNFCLKILFPYYLNINFSSQIMSVFIFALILQSLISFIDVDGCLVSCLYLNRFFFVFSTVLLFSQQLFCFISLLVNGNEKIVYPCYLLMCGINYLHRIFLVQLKKKKNTCIIFIVYKNSVIDYLALVFFPIHQLE